MSDNESETAAMFYAQLNGTVEALALIVGALAATHPEREMVVAAIKNLKSHASAEPSDNDQTQRYKTGIIKATEAVENSLSTAQDAAEIKNLKKQSGSH